MQTSALRKEPNTNTRPALRLIDTKKLNQEQWLDVRKQGIGSSDAAAALGLSPYKSQLELWMEKTGKDFDLKQPDPDDTTEPVFWGNILEPIVAASYTKQTGRKVRKVNAVLQHPEHEFMLANLDREVLGQKDVQILECKTAGQWGARHWQDGVPQYVELQVQHQLAVTGKQAADVAVLICGQKLEVYRVNRDDALIAKLIELEARFWHYVQTDTPPPADGSQSSAMALRALYPQDNGIELDLSQDTKISNVFSDLLEVRSLSDKYKALEESYRQQLQEVMGDATFAKFENGSVSWKKSKDGVSFDSKKFLSEQPDLYQHYLTERKGTRRFLVHA